MLLKFTRPHGPYNPGELAGFDDLAAKRLIALGVAEEVKAPAKTQAVAPAQAELDKMIKSPKGK